MNPCHDDDPILAAIALLGAWIDALPNPGGSDRFETVRDNDLGRLREWKFVRTGELPGRRLAVVQ